MLPYLVFVFIVITRFTAHGECNDCSVPTLVYEELKCTPKFSDGISCCPVEYDCSHIYNRTKGTCHLKGKYYKSGEAPDKEAVAGDCNHATCVCGDKGVFDCIVPSDSCAEFWVPDFVKPGCYLAYEHNRCCHVEQKCPPFSNVKCKVGDIEYKEGEKFKHPTKKCTSCICEKGFNGKFEQPLCQTRNCTTELLNSDKIQKYCAPRYLNADDCCPRSWICPSLDGTYIPASTPPTASTPQCKFGDKLMYIGEIYQHQRNTCKCVIPPYLTCM